MASAHSVKHRSRNKSSNQAAAAPGAPPLAVAALPPLLRPHCGIWATPGRVEIMFWLNEANSGMHIVDDARDLERGVAALAAALRTRPVTGQNSTERRVVTRRVSAAGPATGTILGTVDGENGGKSRGQGCLGENFDFKREY